VRLLVVGDAMLDRDVLGAVERVAPDAPVPVVEVQRTRERPGGAGLAARLLAGRDPMAVTAVQFGAAALVALPVAGWLDPLPTLPHSAAGPLTVAGLILGGTLLPFTLFAYGQARVAPELAGAFLNLEPLVGAVAGLVVFDDPAGVVQLLGGVAILTGIGLTIVPLVRRRRRTRIDAPSDYADLATVGA